MQKTAAYLVFFLMKTSMVKKKKKKKKNKKTEKKVRQEAVAFHSTSKPAIVFHACVN